MRLNGAPVTERGRKIRPGDVVELFAEGSRPGAKPRARVRVEADPARPAEPD